MVKKVQRVRHNSADADAYIGLEGELTLDLDAGEIRMHDGSTPGGEFRFQNTSQFPQPHVANTMLVRNAGNTAYVATARQGVLDFLADVSNGVVIPTGGGTYGFGTGVPSVPDGTFHIHSGSSGSITANSDADDLIVENNAAGGITILVPDASDANFYLGSPSLNFGAAIRWNHNQETNGVLTIGTNKASAQILFMQGAFVEAARFDASARLLIGNTSNLGSMPSGSVLIHTGANTTNPHITASDLVVRGTDAVGINILSGSTIGDFASILFGTDGGDPADAKIQWDEFNGVFVLGSTQTAATLSIVSGNNVEAITIDDVGNVNFVKNLTVAGTFTSLGIDDNATSVALTIDSSERIGIGTTTPDELLHVSTLTANQGIRAELWSASASAAARLTLAHSLGVTDGSHTALTIADGLGEIQFAGSDGVAFYAGAAIKAFSSEAWVNATNDSGTNLRFFTTPNQSQTITEVMRLDDAGDMTVNSLAGSGTRTVVVDANGLMSAP